MKSVIFVITISVFRLLAVALASAITMLSSMAGRMMWWGGAGRRRSDDDRDGNGLEIIMLVVSLLAIVLAPLVQPWCN